jgi:inward rectifier potassium channel
MAKLKRERVRRTHVEGRQIYSYDPVHDFWQDFYHLCLTATWTQFVAAAALAFVLLNMGFAALYLLQTGSVSNLNPPNFWGAFFFSVETLATVGYGDMHPQSLYGHTVATIEVFVGTAGVAVLTGLIFARFSKPKSRILFSQHLVLSNFNGEPTLMLRVANERQNLIANATAKMHIIIREVSLEGHHFRRIYDLDLMRNDQPMFFLSWTLMHRITPSSPLYGMTAQDMASKEVSILLRVVGFDESIAQEIHVRKVYSHTAIRWGHRFTDAVRVDADNAVHIHYQKFHDTEVSEGPQ